MAVLEINGKKVEVDDSFLRLSPEEQQRTVEGIASSLGGGQSAPSNEPRVIFTQGDLKVFEGPDGNRYAQSPSYATSDPERIAQIMAGANAGELSRQSIDQELIAENPGAARASQFARGSLFGSFVDEALGATRGPNAQNAMRALSGAMERERPGESLALNVAGGVTEAGLMAVAAPVAAAGLVGKALGQGPRYVRAGRGLLAGAGAGGVAGGVYGAGEGTDAESRAQGAQTGAAFGAGVGGLLGAAAPVAQDVVQNVAGRFRRSDVAQIARELGISQDAAKVIRNTMGAGGDLSGAGPRLQSAGRQAMLADAGPGSQALLDMVKAGGARDIVDTAIDDRMTRTGQQMNQTFDTILGDAVEGPTTALNAISQRTAPARTAAYEAAYTTPINYADDAGRQIEGVLDRIPPRVVIDAVQEANDSMRARGLQNEQIMASIADNGEVIYTKPLNVQQLDEIKKALQAAAYKKENTDDFGRLNGTGQRLNTLARELRDAVGGAVPDYRTAVALGGDNTQEQRAFKLGRDLLRSRIEIEDVLQELGANPSQAQQEAARSGLRSYIEKTLGDVKTVASDPNLDARQVLRAVSEMSSANAREKIRRLLGPDATPLLSQIEEAARSNVLRAAVSRNSATFPREAAERTVDEILEPGFAGQAAKGELFNTTKALVQTATGQTGEYTAQRRQQIYQDIARALTEKQGPEARAALGVLDRAMQGQELTEAQTSQLASLIAGVLFTGGATGVSSSMAQ